MTSSLLTSGRTNIEAWDGYYSEVVKQTNADKILTLDDDFKRTDIDFELVLGDDEMETLREFMEDLDGIRAYEDIDPSYI